MWRDGLEKEEERCMDGDFGSERGWLKILKPGVGWREEYKILLRKTKRQVGSTVQKRKTGNKLEEQN